MTEPELAERLHELCRMADRLRAPGHRHTPEAYVSDRDEIRDKLRRVYRDLTGAWPAADGPAATVSRRPPLPVPSALARHRARQQPARR